MSARILPRNPLSTVYEYLAMFIGLGSLAVGCLTWLPFAMVLHPLLPQRYGQSLGRRAIMVGFRLYLRILSTLCLCRFDLTELDRLRDAGPLIIAANHPSLLDVVLIVSRLPNAICVMKASLMDNLLFGSAARLARYIRNDGALQMIEKSRTGLLEGAQIVIFPEGTRTKHFPLDALTRTVSLIARRSGIPVQTVLLNYSTPYLGKAWPLFRRPNLPLYCRARLGQLFPAPTDCAEFTKQLEDYFHDELGYEHPLPFSTHE